MTDVRFSCPICKQHMVAEQAFAARVIECPSCWTEITIPELNGQLSRALASKPYQAIAVAAPPILKQRTDEAALSAARRGKADSVQSGGYPPTSSSALSGLGVCALGAALFVLAVVIVVWQPSFVGIALAGGVFAVGRAFFSAGLTALRPDGP